MSRMATVAQMNNLILDFLVVNGYRNVAESFVKEAGLPPVDLTDIENRKQVNQRLLAGQVESAVELINEIDPYFLEVNYQIYFQLLELQMVELIRVALETIDEDAKSAAPVLEFAEKRIIPSIQELPANDQAPYLARVERIMSLICFPLEALSPSVRGLMSAENRVSIATAVNKALLESRGMEGVGKLTRLIKTYVWAGKELESNT